jgi:hypothetical protein
MPSRAWLRAELTEPYYRVAPGTPQPDTTAALIPLNPRISTPGLIPTLWTLLPKALARCAGEIFYDTRDERRIVLGKNGGAMSVHHFEEVTPCMAVGN